MSGAYLYITGVSADSAGFLPNVIGPDCPMIGSAGNKDDAFVAKIDPSNGDCVWAKAVGDSANQSGKSIIADGMGNVLVIGNFAGSITLNGCPTISTTGSADTDVFVAKVGNNGDCVWLRKLGDDAYQHGEDIASADGAIAITGGYEGTFTSATCPSVSGHNFDDIFVTGLAADNTCAWNNGYGNPTIQSGQSVAMDSSGNTYAAGVMLGAIDFGGGALTANEAQIFRVKLDPVGNPLYSFLAGGMGSQTASDLAIGAGGADQVFLTGHFNTTIDFGLGTLVCAGDDDVFLAKFAPDLKPLWSKSFGSTNKQHASGVAVDADGNVIVVGEFQDSIDFGGGSMMSTGGFDVFVAKLSK